MAYWNQGKLTASPVRLPLLFLWKLSALCRPISTSFSCSAKRPSQARRPKSKTIDVAGEFTYCNSGTLEKSNSLGRNWGRESSGCKIQYLWVDYPWILYVYRRYRRQECWESGKNFLLCLIWSHFCFLSAKLMRMMTVWTFSLHQRPEIRYFIAVDLWPFWPWNFLQFTAFVQD